MLAPAFGDPSEAGQLPPSLERQEFTGSGGGDGEEPEVSPLGNELGNVHFEVALALEGRFDEEVTSAPTAEGEVGVQHFEAAGRQERDDVLGNTADAEDGVCSGDAATSQLEDAEVSAQEPNKLAPVVNAEALVNWILEHRDNFKSPLSTPDMFFRTVMNAMDKSGMRATRQVVADSVNHLAALLAHTDTLIDLDTM